MNGDLVLTALGNPLLSAKGNPIIEGKPITGFTANLSTLAGIAFISNPNVNLSLIAGKDYLLTISASGKTITGWAKDAGIGETSDEMLSGWDFTSGWGLSGTPTIIDANSFSTPAAGGLTKVNSLVVGNLFKLTTNLSSTDTPGYRDLSGVTIFGFANSGSGYRTILTGSSTTFYIRHSAAGQTDVTIMTLEKIKTPSITGITIVSESGGVTRNWASNDGLNENVASFTLTITKP